MEEEPEDPDYPKYPGFKEKFGPRGVLHSFATNKDDPTEQPRWGRVGKQKIEDTGPLTSKRMETVDDEFLAATQKFINEAHDDEKPFFVWFNPSRMHFTHISDPRTKESPDTNGTSIPMARSNQTTRWVPCRTNRPFGDRRQHHCHQLDGQRTPL